jgi:DNA-binding MarR family transcriptional regulator
MQRSKLLEESFDVQNQMTLIWKQHFAEMIRKEGITLAQMAILFSIEELQPVMGKELAKRLGQTPSATTQSIDGLPNDSLVIREQDATDRRIIRLRLSKEGEQLVSRLKDKRKEIFYKSAELLSDEELQAHLTFQRKALKQLQAYMHQKQQ